MKVFKGQKDKIRIECEASFDSQKEQFILFFKPLPTSRTEDLMEDGLEHQLALLREFIVDWEIRDDEDNLIPFDKPSLDEFLDILPYYMAARVGLLQSINPENEAKN